MNAYVFPGQSAQFEGMGKDLYENSELAKNLFEDANKILGYRISDVMFEGTSEDLMQTKITQPAVFLHVYYLVCDSEYLNKTPSFSYQGGSDKSRKLTRN